MESSEEAEAIQLLESFLGKTLRIHIPDGRFFLGSFRCTDRDSNIILSNAFEYRRPPERAKQLALDKATREGGTARADMISRFLGLIVVPGKQVVKIEVEERTILQPRQMPLRLKDDPRPQTP